MRLRDWNDEEASTRTSVRSCRRRERVEIAAVDVVFEEQLDLDLGGVTVHVRHVASDHCTDAVIVYVAPDGLLSSATRCARGRQAI